MTPTPVRPDEWTPPPALAARLAPFRPATPDGVVIEQVTARDDLGRCRFVAHSLGTQLREHGEQYGHRAQVLHAVMDERVAELRAAGTPVRVVALTPTDCPYCRTPVVLAPEGGRWHEVAGGRPHTCPPLPAGAR